MYLSIVDVSLSASVELVSIITVAYRFLAIAACTLGTIRICLCRATMHALPLNIHPSAHMTLLDYHDAFLNLPLKI